MEKNNDNNFYEALKTYLETTPRDIIEKDWAKSEKSDTIISPTVQEYLYFTNNINNNPWKD